MLARLRRFGRAALRPLAMTAVAGGLALSLVVTTPSTAEALVKYPKINVDTKFIQGAVQTVAPVAMAAVSVTPVGWGLRLAQLGMLAYSTSDMWMPYVTGAFGSSAQPAQGTGTYYGTADPNLRLQTPVISGSTVTFPRTFQCNVAAGGTCTINHHMAYKVQCVNAAGAMIIAQGVISPISASVGPGLTTMQPSVLTCNSSYPTPTGALAGLAGSGELPLLTGTQRKSGPGNDVGVGSIKPANGFDPNSPEVGYQGMSECIDAQGTIGWVTGPIVPGDNGAMLMPSCEKAGMGHGTGRTKVEAFKPDGTKETVWDTGAQPLSDPATPLCDPGRATSGCVLEVLKDDKPCTSGDVECENWSEESAKDPTSTRWKCKLGPYTLPLSACNLLERAYVPGGSPVNDENTDGNPDTRSPLGPAGQPAPVQSPTVTGTPGIAPAPGVGGQPGPGADDKAKQCFPQGWAMFNPVEWVLKPVGCALEAAFVPKTQTVQATATRIQTKIATVGFGPVTGAWIDTFQAVGGGSGCAGPTVNFNFGSTHQPLQPFNACSQPMSTVAAITYAFSCIVIVLAGGLGIARAIASGFGFNFTLGRGGSE